MSKLLRYALLLLAGLALLRLLMRPAARAQLHANMKLVAIVLLLCAVLVLLLNAFHG